MDVLNILSLFRGYIEYRKAYKLANKKKHGKGRQKNIRNEYEH